MKKWIMFAALIALSVFQSSAAVSAAQNSGIKKSEVTFIELGSLNCVPCKAMQPVMKSIEKKYKGKVKVVFYDVWTEAGAPYAEKYGIMAIPTQIFLDSKGKEFFRHTGFFPESEIDKVLKSKGISQ